MQFTFMPLQGINTVILALCLRMEVEIQRTLKLYMITTDCSELFEHPVMS